MKKLLLVLTVVVMTSFLLVGCLPTPNTAPVITTTALPNATVGTAYTATVEATDADDDALTFSLVSYPTDMVISEAGVISGWTPAAVGTQDVTIAVTDGTDSVSADFTITIDAAAEPPEVNVAPVITSTAVLTATVGEVYTYDVEATDANTGDVLVYSLDTNVAGMGINSASGLITWTPTFAGNYAVSVTVSDGALTDTQSFTVVASDPVVPVLTATIWYNPTHSYDGDYTYVRGYAVADDAVPVEVTVSEALATGEYLKIRWNDGTVNGEYETLTQVGTTLVYEGTLNFDPTDGAGETTTTWDDCKLVCVEVAKFDVDICPSCEPVIILQDTVKVDGVDPELSLDIAFEDCGECVVPGGMYFTFAPKDCEVDCEPVVCCDDDCSEIAGWEISDAATCPVCETLSGIGCPDDTYDCGCLLYATGHDPYGAVDPNYDTATYKLNFVFADNVGNEIVDEWTIVLDTDSVVSFTNDTTDGNAPAVADYVTQTVNIPYTACCVVEPE